MLLYSQGFGEGVDFVVTSLNDPLNLRDYISFVVEFIKRYTTETQPRTLVGFLTTIFKGEDFSLCFTDVTSPEKSVDLVVVTLQKLFSGNVHYTKLSKISNEIVSGAHDSTLLVNFAVVEDAIEMTDRSELFYSQLLQMVSPRFFNEAERNDFHALIDHQEYSYAHLVILKHGLSTLFNVPFFFADRLFEEALTYDYDSAIRFALMKTAAENGSKRAALEYGNYIAKAGPYPEAFNYLLMALPLPAAIWNATYLIEQHQVGEDQEAQLRSSIRVNEKIATSKEFDAVRDEIDSVIYTGGDPAEAQSRLFCYSVYFYLAYRGFNKAFNSMAKMLNNGTIGIYNAGLEMTTAGLREKYLNLAIAGGNITAISNVGNRRFRNLEATDTYDSNSAETRYTEELLVVAASMDLMRANYNLGNYYEFVLKHADNPIKTRSGIEAIYEHAAKLDSGGKGVNGDLYYRMALLAINEQKKKQLFEKALKGGKGDSAYHLSMIYYEEYLRVRQPHLLLKAMQMLTEFECFFSKETLPLARMLSTELSNEIATNESINQSS